MKKIYLLSLSFFAFLSPLEAKDAHKDCVNEATRKYDGCMELANEALSGKTEGIDSDRHTLQEGKSLQQGGCKKLLNKDLEKCPKA